MFGMTVIVFLRNRGENNKKLQMLFNLRLPSIPSLFNKQNSWLTLGVGQPPSQTYFRPKQKNRSL